LAGGAIQNIEIELTTSVPEAKMYTLVQLVSNVNMIQNVILQAFGASSKLVLDNAGDLEFGIIRVGMQKVLHFIIKNEGTLPFKFHILSTNAEYLVEPEQGFVQKNDCFSIQVQYSPSKEGISKGRLIIESDQSPAIVRRVILVSGTGSYPKLVVNTKNIDFGTALFKSANKSSFEVKNTGFAPAKVVFDCIHPDIRLNITSQDDLEVAPNQVKRIPIIYIPKTVEKLYTKAFAYSSDFRGETFMINIKGDVGIPQWKIVPSDALDSIDFGVMKLGKTKTRKFTIINEGTIFLNYKTNFKLLRTEPSYKSSEYITDIRQNLQNTRSAVSVEPAEGKLGVGESVEMVITFVPTSLSVYEYEFILSYEYQSFTAKILGIGGCSDAKIYSPLSTVDFGLCRLKRSYLKQVLVRNFGNLGVNYFVRPEPENGDWSVYERKISSENSKLNADQNTEELNSKWKDNLKAKGIEILNPNGHCGAEDQYYVEIQFSAPFVGHFNQNFRIYHDGKFDFFCIKAEVDVPKLRIRDPLSSQYIEPNITREINIGVHPVKYLFSYVVHLVNEGKFGIDFLVQPMSTVEFEVHPLRAYIDANTTIPITILFQPSSESRFNTILKVMWEGDSIQAKIHGDGGVGQLEMKFLEDKDILLKSLDFGMVPFNTPSRKRFFIINYGLVGVKASVEVENEDYSISQLGGPIRTNLLKNAKEYSAKDIITAWNIGLQIYLPPDSAILVAVKFQPHGSTTSVGDITIRSDSGNFTIPLKGKGGTLVLSHEGDMEFGDISCNYTYSRKIVIKNGGSISAKLNAYWLIVGYSSNQMTSYQKVGEKYSSSDPRSQWARQQLVIETPGMAMNTELKSRQYWRLIMLMIRKDSIKDSSAAGQAEPIDVKTTLLAKRNLGATTNAHFKRRQLFYHLITSTQLTSQQSSMVSPFVKVTPPEQLIQSYGEATFLVEVNLGTEDTFLATLVIKPDITNCPNYEIPLTSTPKLVCIVCDDTRMLNFHRQPLGETETMHRTFTNVGHKDIPFSIKHGNPALSVSPGKGILKIGASITIAFSFRPTEEAIQDKPVAFEPLFSHNIVFKMYGGGGYAKASLSKYRRFDFGHCMIGKDTVSYLPIINEGNAILHLTKFYLDETDTFFRGQNWPTSRISLFPGSSYELPLVFHPHEENPMAGTLIISTNSDNYEIELIGVGREAVLIVSKLAIEFQECLIGNSYEQKLGLKNIGDVNYPVICQLEKPFPDVTFNPSSITITPFSESFITVRYTPSQQTKTNITLILSSPYSTHRVPIMVHSGVAYLEFESSELDFGMFEKSTSPSVILRMKNVGTVKTSFLLKDKTKPQRFNIEPFRGILLPKKSIDITITHNLHEVSQFEEKISIKTDLIDKIYNIIVIGNCEETILHADEFLFMNLGMCPVLEPTTKSLHFKNYGKFPLKFTAPSVYPLKVAPVEGEIKGGETGTLYITWNPSGGYELRSQLSIETNIGRFPIHVRGKSLPPDLLISNLYLDFGICGEGHSYTQNFTLVNRGKVKLHYNIPQSRDPSFTCFVSGGVLEPKEEAVIDVIFTPKVLGKIATSLLIDCRGSHYKEILLNGIGGILDFRVSPHTINLGDF
jgi:hypothetical protein